MDTQPDLTPAVTDEPEAAETFDTVLAAVEEIGNEPITDDATPAEGTTEATESAPDGEPAPEAEADGPETPDGQAPPADSEAETSPTTDAPSAPTSWTFAVDGRDVTIPGAREDGENIVIPKAAWHSQVKNFLADRGAIARREQQREQQTRQAIGELRQQQTAREATATAMLGELDRIMALPPEQLVDEVLRLREGYGEQKAKAEAAFYRGQQERTQQATAQQQAEQQMAAYVPVLQENVKRWAGEAIQQVEPHLKDMSEAERKDFADRLTGLLLEDADAGRIFYHTGRQIEGTTLPELRVDFQRIAAVVEREVRAARKTLDRVASERKAAAAKAAKLAEAAKANADAAARRKGAGAPPAVGAGSTPQPGPKGKGKPKSWDDLMAEVDEL